MSLIRSSTVRRAAALMLTAAAMPLAGQSLRPAPPDSFANLAEALRAPGGVRVLTLRGDLGPLPREIGTLRNLETLMLDRTNLSVLPAEIANLRHLKVLYLGGNPRLDLGKTLTLLATLPALERLGLDDNELSEIPPEVGALGRLRALSLSKNVLTTLPPELARLSALASLNLVQNEFTDVPAVLSRLPRLKTVYVSGNLIDSDRAARFRLKAPQVSVSWHVQDEPYFH